MATFAKLCLSPFYLAGVAGTIILVAAAACGTAATPAQQSTTAPPSVEPSSPTVTRQTATPAPTAMPTLVAAAGKVTIFEGSWGNEKFDPRDGAGMGGTYPHHFHQFIIGGNENNEMIPEVATAWKVSTDGKKWTYTIAKGITFHNGQEITPADVQFSLNHQLDPENSKKALHPRGSTFGPIYDSILVTGPNEVTVAFTKPLAQFGFTFSDLNSSDFGGAIIPQNYYEQVGEAGYESKPIGAGPLKFVRYKPAEQMEFERYDNFWRVERRVKFARLDIRLVPERSTRVSAFRAGQVDFVETTMETKSQIESAGGRLIFVPKSAYTFIWPLGAWKSEVPFSKREVRYALDYAVDKELIRDKLYGGKEVADVHALNGILPGTLGYSPDITPLPYDPVKAKELLAQAGYPNGKDYPPFKLYTWIAGDTPFLPEQAQLIADMWKKNLGLEVEVVVGDPTGIREQLRNRELDGNILLRSGEATWDRGNSFLSFYDKNSQNRVAEDPVLQAAMEATLSVAEPEKRHEAYNQFIRKAWDAHYSWGTTYVNNPWGVSSHIATWQPWSLWAGVSAMWTVTLK